VVQSELLDKVKDDRLAMHVVWTPVLKNDARDEALASQRLLHDTRATHYWDGEMALGTAFGEAVELPVGRDFAWDIYFAFDHHTEWKDRVPQPFDFAHQLGRDDRHLGDGVRLRQIVEKLLAGLE
jgi:hypothetical protein